MEKLCGQSQGIQDEELEDGVQDSMNETRKH